MYGLPRLSWHAHCRLTYRPKMQWPNLNLRSVKLGTHISRVECNVGAQVRAPKALRVTLALNRDGEMGGLSPHAFNWGENMKKMNSTEEQVLFFFYHAVALQAWSMVEHAVARLAASSVEGATAAKLFSAYYGIDSFRSKLEFTARMIASDLDGNTKLKDEWKLLRTAIESASSLRNKLAHWHAVPQPSGGPGSVWHLLRPTLSPRIAKMTNQPTIKLMDLVRAQIQFRRLQVETENFNSHCRGQGDYMPLDSGSFVVPNLEQIRNQFDKFYATALK